jgi:hypothetical protein
VILIRSFLRHVSVQFETVCVDNGHDWESVCVVDSERVDGKKYLVVLTECLSCGKEETRLGDQVPEDMEEWF